jgi:hypothetical protein
LVKTNRNLVEYDETSRITEYLRLLVGENYSENEKLIQVIKLYSQLKMTEMKSAKYCRKSSSGCDCKDNVCDTRASVTVNIILYLT